MGELIMKYLLRCVASVLLVAGGCGQPQQAAATRPVVPIAMQPVEPAYTPHGPGPTIKSRVSGGYELSNDQFRIVISESTGDVIFWGFTGKNRNVLAGRGMYTTLSGLPDVPVRGYVEARDEDTWQFIGEDDNHITWRKIYSLQRDVLLVSIIVQNNRPDLLQTAIKLNGDLPDLNIVRHDPEQFDAFGNYGTVSLHGYNEFHNPDSEPILPTLLQSDTFHLKPAERQSYTMTWVLSAL
jgi:hypothetical protein